MTYLHFPGDATIHTTDMSSSGNQQLVVERSISAPVQRAFQAWADQREVSTWFTPEARQDFRVGGHFSNRGNDRGKYLEIVPEQRLRFTWDNPEHFPGTEVTVEFEPEEKDITTVRLLHDRLTGDQAMADMSIDWEWALDSLKSYLETGAPVGFEDWKSRRDMGM